MLDRTGELKDDSSCLLTHHGDQAPHEVGTRAFGQHSLLHENVTVEFIWLAYHVRRGKLGGVLGVDTRVSLVGADCSRSHIPGTVSLPLNSTTPNTATITHTHDLIRRPFVRL